MQKENPMANGMKYFKVRHIGYSYNGYRELPTNREIIISGANLADAFDRNGLDFRAYQLVECY